MRPAGFFWNPEYVDGPVLVGVFWVGSLGAIRLELDSMFLEGIGDVLEKDQAEHDVLILSSIHVRAQRVGGSPEFGFEAKVRSAVVLFGHFRSPHR